MSTSVASASGTSITSLAERLSCDTFAGRLRHSTRHRSKRVSILQAHRRTSFLSRDKVYAAHQLHVAGLSIRELGRRLAEPYGYASADAAAQALMRGFRFYRLPARDRVEATVAAHLTHGKARRRGQPGSDLAAYVRERRALARGSANS